MLMLTILLLVFLHLSMHTGASDIFWDPSIGVRSADARRSLASASTSQSTSAFAGVVAGAVAGVAMVGALAFAIVKRMGGERSPVAEAAAEAVATEEAPESGL
jgi:membrane protease subunit (stomatin/prohibitin family)